MLPVIETILLRQMASGDRLFLQVYKFIGAQPGKKVYIQSNVHGAEIAGVAHEMNNPLGFIAASLKLAKPTFTKIIEHLKFYQVYPSRN